MRTAYLALGSNLGDRLGQMRQALGLLGADERLVVEASSPIYQNRAVGMGDADDFLNAVVRVRSDLDPEALLDRCLEVETRLGRVRADVWVPRTIDLDVLWFEGVECDTERLQLPHPRIAERDFVAKPLCDLDPELVVFNKSIQEILDGLAVVDLELFAEEL